MENQSKSSNPEKLLKSISWVLIGVIIIVFLVPFLLPTRFCFASIDYATFVGGLAGPLASLVGFIYVYLTFLGQQRQLDEQRERLGKEDAAKSFDMYFGVWMDFRAKVSYSQGGVGNKAFKQWWKNVSIAVNKGLGAIGADIREPAEISKSLTRHFYSKGFNGEDDQYDNYMRLIYALVEIAEQNSLQERIKILESIMSREEKAILLYSATFIDENQSAIKLFKSGFCKSIPDEYLISPDHRNLIF